MSKNQFLLLLVLVLVVGGAGLLVYKKNNQDWSNNAPRLGEKIIDKDAAINDVAKLAIVSPTGSLNLEKVDNRWTVKERMNYPADFSRLQDFVQKVWELKVAQPKRITESQLNRFNLLAPDKGANAGTQISFLDKDGTSIAELRIGKQHMREGGQPSPFGGAGGYPDGRYVMLGDNVESVALVKDPLSDVSVQADAWLSKNFVKVDGARKVAVTTQDKTNSWTVTRATRQGDWALSSPNDGEAIDKAKVSGLNSVLSSPSFTDVVVGKTALETGLDKPHTVTIDTFDDFTYVVNIGSTNSTGSYHVKFDVSANIPTARQPAEDEKPDDKARLDTEFKEKIDKLNEQLNQEKQLASWTYLVSKWTIDAITKPRAELMAEKTEDAGNGEVPNSPLIGDPTVPPPAPPKVTSPAVRVPPVPEPVVPTPTNPGEEVIPKTPKEPEPIKVEVPTPTPVAPENVPTPTEEPPKPPAPKPTEGDKEQAAPEPPAPEKPTDPKPAEVPPGN